jgi:CHAT domain-containing protein
LSLSPETALAEARRLLEVSPPWPAVGDDAATLAWALKQLCYEAWGSEPARAVQAANALRVLFEAGVPATQAAEVEALCDWTTGIALTTQGRMCEAVSSFDQAEASFRAAGLPDAAAQTQVPKIMALSMLGRHDEAAACGAKTQRELVALGNLVAASRVSLNLGAAHLRRDQYAESARYCREAAVLFARTGEALPSIMADIGTADALAALGDFDEALRVYARARMRAEHRQLGLPLALVDESIALVELARGRYREALAGLESARRRYEALALPQHLTIAEKQLADAYLELRLLPEAWALFDTAVAKFQALELPDEQAWALSQRGRAEALLGRAGADASFAAAATLFVAHGNAVGQAAVALSRAELALSGGDSNAALAWAEQAVLGFTQAGQTDGRSRAEVIRAQALVRAGRYALAGAAFDATLAQARELRQIAVQVRCLSGSGLVAQALGDTTSATAAFDAAIELFEDQRRALPSDDIRSAFLTEHLRPYQERLRIAMASGDAAQVLFQLDRFRARALDERLADAPAAHHSGDNDSEDVLALRTRLNWLYRRAGRLLEDAADTTASNQEIWRIEHDLLERTRRRRLTAPVQLGDAAEDFSVLALQQALGEADALIEYGVLDDELFACVVTRSKVRLLRHMAAWPEVLEAVQAARFQIDTLRHGAASVRKHLPVLQARTQARLAALHGLMWAPLSDELQSCRRVLVVPHAQLGWVPFAALTDGQTALGERFELAIAPSARLALRGLRHLPVQPLRGVALGESSRLSHTAREASFVASLFDDGHAFVGEQASLAVLQAQAPGADVLHLACHAQFRSDNPRFSALHLSDAALTVECAEVLGLKACTVVLSACETGVTGLGSGDEMVGLVRAFMVAGASRVLASLWPVDDEITVAFMAQFYTALLGGQSAAASLRLAQTATAYQHPHPHFWAAFTLYGGW